MIRSIVIDTDGKDDEGNSKYTVTAREGRVIVHQVTFFDPEYAEFYAEQYAQKKWNNSHFSNWMMHAV